MCAHACTHWEQVAHGRLGISGCVRLAYSWGPGAHHLMCLAQEPRGLEETSSPDPLPPRLPPCSGGGGQLGLNVAHLTWEDALYCSERLASVDSACETLSSFPRTCSRCSASPGPRGSSSSPSQPRVFLLGSPVGSRSSSVHSGLFLTFLPPQAGRKPLSSSGRWAEPCGFPPQKPPCRQSSHEAAQAGPSAPVLLASVQPSGMGLEPWSLAPAPARLLSHPGLQGRDDVQRKSGWGTSSPGS